MTSIERVRALLALGAVGGIRLGEPSPVGALTLVPMFNDGGATLDYLTYAETDGRLRISEVGEGGTVPQLLVENATGLPVLLVEGEVLAGLKQSRTLNTTLLVPAGKRVDIPVSCVEAGRWSHRSSLASKDVFNLSPKVRSVKEAAVIAHLRASGKYDADQSAVWAGIEERLARHGVGSATSTFSDIGRERAREIEDALRRLEPARGQVGVLAMVAGEPLALDLFDRASTLRALWRGIVGSYVADAFLEAPAEADPARATRWIGSLARGEATEHAAVGVGTTVAITSGRDTAHALVADGVVVHLAATRAEDATADIGRSAVGWFGGS